MITKPYEIESNRKKHNLEGITADGEHGEASEIKRESTIEIARENAGYWLANTNVKFGRAERSGSKKGDVRNLPL